MHERELLDRHFGRWREEGLLDGELEARLRRASEPLLEREPVPWVRWALAVLGGGLVLAGLILVVAENWALIPRWGKLASWGLLQIGFLLGAEEAGRRFERPFLAEALALVAGGWILAGIALVSQIYHLTSRPANGFWLWLLLLLPIAWLLPRRATAVVAFSALTAALIAEVSDPLSLVAVRDGSGPWLALAIPLLALFAVSWLPRPAPWLRGFLGAWTFAASQVILLVFGAEKELGHNDLGRAWIVAGAGLAVALLWPGRTLPPAWGAAGARAILVVSLLPWALLGRAYDATDPLDVFALGVAWVAQIAAALLLIRCASRSGSPLWVNLGFVALLAGILTRYFDLFGDYLQGGLALAMTGVLILVVVTILERSRRRALAGRERAA